MKTVIFAPTFLRSKFFFNLYNQILQNKKHEVIFITIKQSAFNFLKSKGVNVINLKHISEVELNEDQRSFFQKRMEQALLVDKKIGILSEKKLISNYWYLVKRLVNFFQKNECDNFLIFNGSAQYIEFVAKLVGQYFNCNNIFFEIGNFPDKIFVDKKGVNADSSLMELDLRNFPCDLNSFLKFKENYLFHKEQDHFVPQAKVKVNNFYKILDHDRFEPSVFFRGWNFLKKFKKEQIVFDYLPDEKFLFFPLQVSYDSQVLRFSDVSLLEAIDIASDEAKKKDLMFVVKPHPAELNHSIINYARKKGALIVNTNTYQLLKKASKIYTINSTVGLESFFYNKPLTILGKAFYKKYLNDSYENKLKVLCNYMNNILLNGNYFDEKVKIDKKILKFFK